MYDTNAQRMPRPPPAMMSLKKEMMLIQIVSGMGSMLPRKMIVIHDPGECDIGGEDKRQQQDAGADAWSCARCLINQKQR